MVVDNISVLYVLICMFISFSLLYILILSSTIFIGLLVLLSLFAIQIIMLYVISQQLFALFLLGVYVGAILVFFVFVVMSFIFFGKTYILGSKLWVLLFILPVFYVIYFYINAASTSILAYDSIFFYNINYNMCVYSFDELGVVGLLLFDVGMMYIVIVISLLLFVALIGSITFNASSLVKYSSTLYMRD